MRNFSFDLRLPSGAISHVAVDAPCERWPEAFSRACRMVETAYGIPPFSEIVCVAYRATPLA